MKATLRDSLPSEGSGEGWHLASPGERANLHICGCRLLFQPPLGLSHSVVVIPFPAHLGTAANTPVCTDILPRWGILLQTPSEAAWDTTFYGLNTASPRKTQSGLLPTSTRLISPFCSEGRDLILWLQTQGGQK